MIYQLENMSRVILHIVLCVNKLTKLVYDTFSLTGIFSSRSSSGNSALFHLATELKTFVASSILPFDNNHLGDSGINLK